MSIQIIQRTTFGATLGIGIGHTLGACLTDNDENRRTISVMGFMIGGAFGLLSALWLFRPFNINHKTYELNHVSIKSNFFIKCTFIR